MPAMRVCPTPGCPEPVTVGPCPECARARDRARGTKQARGYDRAYEQARKQWAARVQLGTVDCHAPTCLAPDRRIGMFDAWDLGHDDDRNIRGPEHRRCNRSAGGRDAHRYAR